MSNMFKPNQKNYVSLYVCAVIDGRYVAEAHKKELGKVSVGKSCIRFKKVEDVNLPALKKVIALAARNPGLVGAGEHRAFSISHALLYIVSFNNRYPQHIVVIHTCLVAARAILAVRQTCRAVKPAEFRRCRATVTVRSRTR
jgi:hypothetical protein